MSEKGAAFRIDVILQSVNELRQEKRALEQRYTDEKNRNKSLEMKLDQDTMRFNQSRERNAKMQETVKLAEEKVSQTESQTDRLTEINDVKQNLIADLNEKIKQEMEQQDCDVAKFETKLLELTHLFRNAKQVYAKDGLKQELEEWKNNMEIFVAQVDKKMDQLNDVTKAFENLSVDNNKIKALVGEKIGHKDLTYKDLQVVIDILSRKQEQLDRFFEWTVSSHTKAQDWLNAFQNLMTKRAMFNIEGGMDYQMAKMDLYTQNQYQDAGRQTTSQQEARSVNHSIFRSESLGHSTNFLPNDYDGTSMSYTEPDNQRGNAPLNIHQRSSVFGAEPAHETNTVPAGSDQTAQMFGNKRVHQSSNIPPNNHQETPMFSTNPQNQPNHNPSNDQQGTQMFGTYQENQYNYVQPNDHHETQMLGGSSQRNHFASDPPNDQQGTQVFDAYENQYNYVPSNNRHGTQMFSAYQENHYANDPPNDNHGTQMFSDYQENQPNYVPSNNLHGAQSFDAYQGNHSTNGSPGNHQGSSMFYSEPENQPTGDPRNSNQRTSLFRADEENQSSNSQQRSAMSQSPFFISLPFSNSH